MILVQHLVVPCEKNPRKNEIGGAYVVSYVNHTDAKIAVQMATIDEIDDSWAIQDFEGIKEIERNQYKEDDPNLQYFDQALVDSVVSVFHTYPIEDKEQ